MAVACFVATEMMSLSSVMPHRNHPVSRLRPEELNRRALLYSSTNNKVKSSGGYAPLVVRSLKGQATVLPAPVTVVENGIMTSEILPGRTKVVKRNEFPPDFKFGCSTSAIQTEGSGTEGGRGPSTWDIYIDDGDLDRAADSYHRYKEDVQLLKNLGANSYRFSMSWSRILPDGTISGGINQKGINFYNNLIDELLKNGITPFVTLFHFDLPTALQDKYNGFLNKQIVDDFKAYADLCFKTFGDRVKHWTTVNEPQIFGQFGFQVGLNPEYPQTVTDPFVATHNMLLAHAAAATLYKQTYQPSQKGEIGISIVAEWMEPYENTKAGTDAAERAFDFRHGWPLEPLVHGDYPFIMKALVRDGLPTFSEEEKASIKGSYDFIGLNYYTARYAKDVPFSADKTITDYSEYQHATITPEKDGVPIGKPVLDVDPLYVYPQGLTKALVFMSKIYNNPKFYITENGYPDNRDDTIPIEEAIKDNGRIQFIQDHLYAIKEAMKKGADVNGYFMWSLLDSVEAQQGYTRRFGLNYTDYTYNLNRTPKKSAGWFKSWVEQK